MSFLEKVTCSEAFDCYIILVVVSATDKNIYLSKDCHPL
jgi:hypothetical protein